MGNVSNYNLRNFYGMLKTDNPLYKYQFIAEFGGDIDDYGITDSSDAKKNVTYYVQSANIPGVELTTAKTPFLGTEFRNPGVAKYAHEWTCNVMLNQDMTIYKGFERWMENISTLYKDGGGWKGVPNAYVKLSVLDSSGMNTVQTIILEGIWPSKLGDLSMKYQQGGGEIIKNFAVTLKYQYNYIEDDGDPLGA